MEHAARTSGVPPDAERVSRTRRTGTARSGHTPPVSPAELVALGAIALAFVVGAVAAVRSGWLPIADEALIELRVRDVPSHLPLVGVYSRFGWNHPGPLQFWLLAVPYRLAGSSSAALLVGTMIGHLVAVVTAWWLARRIAVLAGWTVLVSLMVVLATTPADLVRTPWNPYVALVAAGAAVVAAWAVAERDPWGVVAFVVLGSLLVQAHVVTLPVVALLGLVAIAAAWWPRGGTDDVTVAMPWRAVGWSALLAVVLWSGPVLDLFVGDPSNSNLLDSESDAPREGLAHGVSLLTRELAWWPAWARPSAVTQVLVETSWLVPVWLCLPVAGVVVALVRRDRRFVRGSLVAAGALVGIVATTTLLTGGLFNYLIVEYRSLVAVVLAIGAAAVLQLVPDRRRGVVSLVAAVLVVVLAGVVGVRQLDGTNPQPGYTPTVRALASAVEAGEGDQVSFLVGSAEDFSASEIAAGLMLQLERAGHTVAWDPADPRKFGRHRVDDGTADVELRVAPVDQAAGLEADGWSVLGTYAPLTEEERAGIDDLVAQREALAGQLGDGATGSARDATYAAIQSLTRRIDALESGHIEMLVAARPVDGG